MVRSTKMTIATIAVLAATATEAKAQGPQFVDATGEAGLFYRQADPNLFLPVEYIVMTGGAAATDYDGDGWVDLFVTRLDDTDILFRNKGENAAGVHQGFEDVTQSAFGINPPCSRTNGAVWGDIDNDGDSDLFVTSLYTMRYLLYINDGAGHFTEEGLPRGAALATGIRHYGWSAAFGDYDGDGYLDLYVSEWGNPNTDDQTPSHSRLLHNRGAAGPGVFEDVTRPAGVSLESVTGAHASTVYSFAPRFSDLDLDGRPDLFIAADFGTSRLFWNEGGRFMEGTRAAGVGTDENGMGCTIGDMNGDGLLDIFVTSIFDPDEICAGFGCNWGYSGNRLFLNEGGRTFADRTDDMGVREGGWGWGASHLDYDNDGDLDLVMTNGVNFLSTPLEDPFNDDPMKLWRNDVLQFTEVSASAGMTDTRSGKGLLTFDYDRDGDVDVFIVNNAGTPVLYRNDGGNEQSWLRVRARGTTSNRDGVGTWITVTPVLGGPSQVRETSAGSNFLGQNEPTEHFGLGFGDVPVSRVEIRWQSGETATFLDVPRNTTLDVVEP